MPHPFFSTSTEDDGDACQSRHADPRHLGLLSTGASDEPAAGPETEREHDEWRGENGGYRDIFRLTA